MHTVQTTSPGTTSVLPLRAAGAWMLTFAGFPLGGVLARLVAGPVDGAVAAIVGGLVGGAVLGGAQAWALGGRRPPVAAWVAATAVGLALGLVLGAGAVDYGTSMSDLVVQGAVCGVCVGLAQAIFLLPRLGPVALVWPVFLGGAWALGWAITTAIGVDVERQYTVFGSSGAVTVTALTLVLPVLLNRAARKEIQS